MRPTWMKFHFDFFDDARVKVIEDMPDSDALLSIWFKLLAFVGRENTGGRLVLRGREDTPCTDELFASIIKRPLPTVRLALATYEQMGMLERDGGVRMVADWGRYVDESRLRRLDARRGKTRATGRAAREEAVLAYAAEHPEASQVRIARETGVPRSTVQRYLGASARAGLPTAQKGCPNGHPRGHSGIPWKHWPWGGVPKNRHRYRYR